MKKLTLMSRLLLAVVIAGLSVSCNEDKDAVAPSQGEAPALPPSASFDIYEVMKLPKREGAENGRSAQEYDNFGHAYASYLGWQTGLAFHLAYPAIAFKAAFDDEPEYLSDQDRWVWTYDATLGSEKFEVSLYGKKVDKNSEWEMLVSKAGGKQDVVWVAGTSALDGSGGAWTISEDFDDPKKVLGVVWGAKQGQDAIPYVKYTGIDSESKIYNHSIEYGSLANSDFRVFYNIYNAQAENTINIEFDNKTNKGRISDLAEYEDDAWHCWNGNFVDTVCE